MAVTQARNTPQKKTDTLALKMASGETVYEGAKVCMNSSGYAINAVKATGNVFMGVAAETVDNSAGGDGDKTVKVFRKYAHEFASAGLTQADLGKKVYLSDNETVGLSVSYDIYVGNIMEVISATRTMVDIEPATGTGL